MKEKNCCFEFGQVGFEEVEKLLFSINNDKPPGINLDIKLLRMVADCIASPICHVFNQTLRECVCPQAWKEVIPLPKNSKACFAGFKQLTNQFAASCILYTHMVAYSHFADVIAGAAKCLFF
jgi:hypothetical protein